MQHEATQHADADSIRPRALDVVSSSTAVRLEPIASNAAADAAAAAMAAAASAATAATSATAAASSPSPSPWPGCNLSLPFRSPLSTPSAAPSPDSACFLDPVTGDAFHWYLAIGSMINPTSLKLRKLAPIESRPAILRGWRLVFRGDCGMASILECSSPLLQPIDPNCDPALQHRYRCSAPARDDFHGVLHRLSMDQMRKLDVIESSYDRLDVYVDLYDGSRQKATVYKMAEEKLDPSVPDALPSERYLDIISRGCVAFGVAAEYIEWLRSHDMVRRKPPSEYKKIPVHALHQSGKGLHLTAELLAKYDGSTLIPDEATEAIANALEKKRRQQVAAEAKRRKAGGAAAAAAAAGSGTVTAIPSAIPAPVAVAPVSVLGASSSSPSPALRSSPAPSASPSMPGLPSVSPLASPTVTPGSAEHSASPANNGWAGSASPASHASESPSPAAAASSSAASIAASSSSSASTPAPAASSAPPSDARRYPLRIAVNAKVLEWIGDLSQPLLANTYEFMRYNFGGSDLTHSYTCVFFEPLYPIRSSYKDMSLEHRAMIEDIFYVKCFHPDVTQREWKLVGFLSREEQKTSQKVGRAKLRKNHRGGKTGAGATTTAAAAAAAVVRDPSAPRAAVVEEPDVDDESELRMPENLFLSLSMEDHSGASSTCFAFCCSGARPFHQQARALAYRSTNAAAGAQRVGAALLARQAGAGGQAVSAIQQAEAKRKRRHSIGNVGLHVAAAAAAAAADAAIVCHCGAASASAPSVCTCGSLAPSSVAPSGSPAFDPSAASGSDELASAPTSAASSADAAAAAAAAPVLRAPRPHLPVAAAPVRPRLVRSASICSGMLDAFQRAAAAAESLVSPMSRAGGGGGDSAAGLGALSPSRRERRNSADGLTVRSPSAAVAAVAAAVSPTAAEAITRQFGFMMTSPMSRASSTTGEAGTPAPSPAAKKHSG